MKKIRVAVNGYGVIGKRVADAVTLQDDMELGIPINRFRKRIRVWVSEQSFKDGSKKNFEKK
ncbi:MAG: hypothetical protein ABI663_07165 [Chryseolinea sp.]